MDNELRKKITACWPKAQKYWSNFLMLSEPIDDCEQISIAQIHLGTRQVSINSHVIREKNLEHCLEALLAHEIGHHIRYPGTLSVDARMRLLEKTLIPLPDYSLINLFTDLMINEKLGTHLKQQMIEIYQAFHHEMTWKQDPVFLFYLSIYEELWQTATGAIMGTAHTEFAEHFPNYRAEAQILAQNIFHLGPNIYTQFIYFISVACRYIKPISTENPVSVDPYQCGKAEPSPEEWAEALLPNAQEKSAISKAEREGWISSEQREKMDGQKSLERRILGLPGSGTRDCEKVPEIMAAYYRQQAEKYLFTPPPQQVLGEAVVPTTTEDWEHQDAVQDIDWLTTLTQRGNELGVIHPIKRIKIAEVEGYDVPLWQPRIEIYLDISGSMPDPRMSHNAMTLAAQILTIGATRAGGWVRALMYSSEYVTYWQWCRSELEMSRFLMHYIGGGTNFPFAKLEESIAECRDKQPIRVIVTDTDFDYNYDEYKNSKATLSNAVSVSPFVVILQHGCVSERAKLYKSIGMSVIPIVDMEDYPKMAAQLATALFVEKHHEA